MLDSDLDTLATVLFVKTDDLLKQTPRVSPPRPGTGIQPLLTDAVSCLPAGTCMPLTPLGGEVVHQAARSGYPTWAARAAGYVVSRPHMP